MKKKVETFQLLSESFRLCCVIRVLEMDGRNGEERIVHEVAIVVPKRVREEEEEGDCVEVLVSELKKRGMVVDRVVGLADEFLKVSSFSFLRGYCLNLRSEPERVKF